MTTSPTASFHSNTIAPTESADDYQSRTMPTPDPHAAANAIRRQYGLPPIKD